MKIFLTILMCAATTNECMPPHTFPNPFTDMYECLLDGYKKSYDKTMEIGRYEINKHQIYIKFECHQVIIPEPKPKINT